MEIKHFNSKEEATAEAGETLNTLLTQNRNKPVLLMLSAGSCLPLLAYVGSTALGENLTVSMLDDRFSQDPEINNFHQLQKLDFYTDSLEHDVSFFGTLPRVDDTMETMVKRWEENLRTWREENPKGLIVATLGMGPDGHTGGVFPNADESKFDQMFLQDAWTTAYNVGEQNKFKERITTTFSFLKNVDHALAFVCGEEKKQKLNELQEKKGGTNEFPALFWHEIKNVTLFTDLG